MKKYGILLVAAIIGLFIYFQPKRIAKRKVRRSANRAQDRDWMASEGYRNNFRGRMKARMYRWKDNVRYSRLGKKLRNMRRKRR